MWSTNQVEGVHRFLARSYRLVTGDSVTEDEPTKDQLRSLHIAIKRVLARLLFFMSVCCSLIISTSCLRHMQREVPYLLGCARSSQSMIVNNAWWLLPPWQSRNTNRVKCGFFKP